MEANVSKLIKSATELANQRIMGGTKENELNVLDIALEVVYDSYANLNAQDFIFNESSSLFQYRSLVEATESQVRALRGDAILLFEAGLAEGSRLNSRMHDLLSFWLESNDIESIDIGGRKLASGSVVELLSFIGIHATACLAALEVLTLTRVGLIEGARARCRAIHEANVIAATILRGRESGGLADRWHISGQLRHARYIKQAATDWADERPDLALAASDAQKDIDQILQRFPGLNRGDYEWARPAFPGHSERRRITFSDLESYCGLPFRGRYLQLSDSVHLSARRVVTTGDFSQTDAYRTIPEFNRAEDADVLNLAHCLLFTATEMTYTQVCVTAKQYDELYELGPSKILWDAHDSPSPATP